MTPQAQAVEDSRATIEVTDSMIEAGRLALLLCLPDEHDSRQVFDRAVREVFQAMAESAAE